MTNILAERAVRRAIQTLDQSGVPLAPDMALQAVSYFTSGRGPFECRCVPALGFGGKLRWDHHGGWHVDGYQEDLTSDRVALARRINAALRHCHPYPDGARVYHGGQRWGAAMEHGTANVVEVVPQRDGTYEYLVRVDEGVSWPTAGGTTWWASYHTDVASGPLP